LETVLKKLKSLSGERIEEIVADALKKELGGEVNVQFRGLQCLDSGMDAVLTGEESFDLQLHVTTHSKSKF
jgi:hypothetical protein